MVLSFLPMSNFAGLYRFSKRVAQYANKGEYRPLVDLFSKLFTVLTLLLTVSLPCGKEGYWLQVLSLLDTVVCYESPGFHISYTIWSLVGVCEVCF